MFGTTMVRDAEQRHFPCEMLVQLKFKWIQSFIIKQDELQSHFVSAHNMLTLVDATGGAA